MLTLALAIWLLVVMAGLAYAAHSIYRAAWLGRAATACLALAWTLLLLTLVVRGILAGHWPLGTQYEFSLCLAWIVAGLYLALECRWRDRRAGAYAALVLMLLSSYAVFASPTARAIGPLPPVLRSPWLQGHVITALLGYGSYGVAAALSLARLAYPEGRGEGEADDVGWLPPREELEQAAAQMVALGLPWLTLGLLTGAIWAQNAWGRYWGWDPKETWALITWLWFLMLLHLYPQSAWRGRRIAWLVVIGFALILFTFVGVPRLASLLRLDSLHGLY